MPLTECAEPVGMDDDQHLAAPDVAHRLVALARDRLLEHRLRLLAAAAAREEGAQVHVHVGRLERDGTAEEALGLVVAAALRTLNVLVSRDVVVSRVCGSRTIRYRPGMPTPASGRILLAWAVLVLVVTGLGTFVRRVCRAPAATISLLDFWIGWAALIVLLQAWHLVLPIDTRALGAVLALGMLGLGVMGLHLWRALLRQAREHPLALTAVVVVALWLSRQCLDGPRHGDSAAYHIPTMRWLVEYPVVPGLVNLFPFLAYNQSFFLYTAMLDVGPLAGRATHLANGLLVLLLFARAWLGVARAASWRSACAPTDLYYALLLPGIVGLAFDITLTSPTPDIAVFALEGVLAGALLAYIAAGTSAAAVAWMAPVCALLAAVGVTVKLSFAGLTAAALPLVLVVTVRRAAAGASRLAAAGAVVAPATLVILPWMLHGIVLSGYPLYPSPFGPLPLEWRAPLAATIRQAEEIRYWNGTPVDLFAIRNPRWLAARLAALGWGEWGVLLPLAVAVVVLPAAIANRLRRRGPSAGPPLPLIVLVPPLAGLAFSLVAAPQARFAGALPWVLAAQTIVLAVGRGGLAAERRLRPTLAATAVAVAALHLRDGPLFRPDLVTFQVHARPDVLDVRLATGLTVKVPRSTGQCWDAPPPCTPSPNRALRLRREGDLAGGFVIDPTIEPGPP